MKAVGRSVVRLPGPWSLHRRHRPTEVDKDVRSSGESKAYKRCKACKKLSNVTDNRVFLDRWKDTLRAGRELYGHTVQSVAARLIVHFINFLNVPRHGPGLHEPGFMVSFTSGFDQLKI